MDKIRKIVREEVRNLLNEDPRSNIKEMEKYLRGLYDAEDTINETEKNVEQGVIPGSVKKKVRNAALKLAEASKELRGVIESEESNIKDYSGR